ncbi:hypothetical protein STANM309S_01756 [Streptomyces tanashiensis]
MVEPAEHLQVLPAAQLLVEGGVLSEQADPPPYLPGPGPHVVARDPYQTLVVPEQGGQDPYGRGLARAVGAEQAVDGPPPDGEVEPVQGVLLPVPLPRALHEDRFRCHPSPPACTLVKFD